MLGHHIEKQKRQLLPDVQPIDGRVIWQIELKKDRTENNQPGQRKADSQTRRWLFAGEVRG